MNNGTTDKVVEHFNRVAKLPDKWDHNQHYQKYMLKNIRKSCQYGLDIGCGTGEFTKRLITKCENVVGIDIAPIMVDEAISRNSSGNLVYAVCDADSYLSDKRDYFDTITSIAAFHHMDFEAIISKCKDALKPGGVLVIQDIYQEDTLIFKFMSFLGVILHPIYMIVKNGRFQVSKEESEVWSKHKEDDVYNTLTEIRKMALNVLPDVKIKRHIFWRYTLAYRK